MGFKAQGNNYDGPKIDYDAINSTFEDDTYDARVSVMIDMGIQKRSDSLSHEQKGDITYVATEDEANDLIDRAEELVGEWVVNKENLDEFEEVEIETEKQLKVIKEHIKGAKIGDEVFSVPFRIYSRKDAQEVAIFADLVDHYVEYVEGEDEKQYRHMFNKNDFVTKELVGFSLTVTKPKSEKDTHWTYSPNSMLAKLAKATGRGDILTDSSLENDISLILGQPLGIPFKTNEKKDKVYLKAGAPVALKKKEIEAGITELDVEPVAISFEDATLEQLQEAKPRKAVLDKIKKALNYEGSAMQEAVEAYEAVLKAPKTASEDDEEESSTKAKGKAKRAEEASEEESEAPKKRGRKKKEEGPEEKPKKRKAKAKKKEPEPEVDDEFDEDSLPF